MTRSCGIAVVAALVLFSVPASGQPARIAELERKVRDAERQRDDARRD